MSNLTKYHQILCFFFTFFLWKNGNVSLQISTLVLFNDSKFPPPGTNGTVSPALADEKSFKMIPTMQEVNFVFKYFSSLFCDLGTFLFFLEGRSTYDFVVLLLGECHCERKLLIFLDMFDIKYVSRCEQTYFTARGASAIIQRIKEQKQLYLFVPAHAYGLDFYHDIDFELQRQKLKLNRTFWVGVKSGESDQLGKEFNEIARNLQNDKKLSAVFVLGFLDHNDSSLKTLTNVALRKFGTNFSKIFWMLPVMHLDFSNIQSIHESAQVLAFRPGNLETLNCKNNKQDCSLRKVLEKANRYLNKCWRKHLCFENFTVCSEETAAVSEYSVEPISTERMFSAKTQDCKISEHHYFTDVVQLTKDCYFEGVTWKRVATWNGKTVQSYAAEEEENDDIFRSSTKTVFRVPIVEYFPFLMKSEWHDLGSEYPVNFLPCYGQNRGRGDTMVINYTDRYFCWGWTVDMLTDLTVRLSYEFELYFQAEELYGVYDGKNGKWNGVIQDIISGKGDISVDLSIRPDRCSVLDCSLGYLVDRYNAIIKLDFSKKENEDRDSFHELVGNFRIFLHPFKLDLLVTCLVVFNMFLLLIWATDKICLFYRNKVLPDKQRQKFTLLEATSYIWATAFGRDVGDSKKPLTMSARYMSSWLAFLALIFVNVYVARLMADIVEQESNKPFTSLKDPKILNKNLKLGMIKGGSIEAFFHTTHDKALKQIFENNIKFHLFPSLDSGERAVNNGSLDGFIADRFSLVTILNKDPQCSLSLMGEDFFTSRIGFMFRKDWPWAEELKREELSLIGSLRFENLWKLKQRHRPCDPGFHHDPRLGVGQMSGLFLILIFSIGFCCISLLLENIFLLLLYCYRNSHADWNVSESS